MKNNQLSEIIEIINDAEDMINGGWKTGHPGIEISRVKPAALAASPIAAASAGDDILKVIAEEIDTCTACGLYAGRNYALPGAGVIRPAVMFIGEGPGEEEDKTGMPFVGSAGQYLDKWLAAIELNRAEDCFIGNIIKCRPPGNRDPYSGEIAACKPFLTRQLQIIKPEIIITLGRLAAQVLCNSEAGLGVLRGRTHSYEGIPVVPTYHPSEVLCNPELRSDVWADLKKAKDLLNEIKSSR